MERSSKGFLRSMGSLVHDVGSPYIRTRVKRLTGFWRNLIAPISTAPLAVKGLESKLMDRLVQVL